MRFAWLRRSLSTPPMFSSSDSRLAAAQRFAMHSRVAPSNEAGHAAAAMDATAASSVEDDLNNYDRFVEQRDATAAALPRPAVATPAFMSSPTATAAGVAPLAPIHNPFVSSWSSSFGEPVRPRTAEARRRRMGFMRRVLMHSLNASADAAAASASIGESSTASAAASASSSALDEASLLSFARSLGGSIDYFTEEEMEARRPGLFREYVGQYRTGSTTALGEEEEEEEEAEDDTRFDQAEEEEEKEQKEGGDAAEMTDAPSARNNKSASSTSAHIPLANGGGGRGRGRNNAAAAAASAAAARARSHRGVAPGPAPLPSTLSELLLRNYDRDQIRQQLKAEQTKASAPHSAPHAAAANNSAATTSANAAGAAASPARPRHRSALLADDESELESSSDDDSDASRTARRIGSLSMGPLHFSADDGSGLGGMHAGPTSSAEAAARARELVEDDMDVQATKGGRGYAQAGAEAFRARQQQLQQQQEASTAAAAHVSAVSTSPSSVDPPLDSSDLHFLRQEFLRLMQRLFLDGYDGMWVRYAALDDAAADSVVARTLEALEDPLEREREEQDKYFEQDDDEEEGEEGIMDERKEARSMDPAQSLPPFRPAQQMQQRSLGDGMDD